MNFQNFINESELQYWKKYINSNSMLKSAIFILNKIENKGYKAFIVGGSVRDLILGIDPHDVDICGDAPLDVIDKLFKYHEIGTSRDFGIIVIEHNGFTFEYAMFRSDNYQKIKGVRKIL